MAERMAVPFLSLEPRGAWWWAACWPPPQSGWAAKRWSGPGSAPTLRRRAPGSTPRWPASSGSSAIGSTVPFARSRSTQRSSAWRRGDAGATRTLFDQAAAGAAASGNRVAVTIVAANNQPLAWVGRSEEVPDDRLTGRASMFLLQSTQGLQLIRVQPAVDAADPGRHIGAVVAEASLGRDGQSPAAGTAFALETSIAPAPLRLQFEGAADAGPEAFIVRSPTGEPLAAVEVPDSVLHEARARMRQRRAGVELALLAVLLLLATGPLLDWRRVTGAWPRRPD